MKSRGKIPALLWVSKGPFGSEEVLIGACFGEFHRGGQGHNQYTERSVCRTATPTDGAPSERKPHVQDPVQDPPPEATPADIAIVGLACRMPHARNAAEFWENLETGKNCVTEIPDERWDLWSAGYTPHDEEIIKHARHGALVDDIDAFDAAFFGISPVEAQHMDPQQRMLMELTWSCIEDAAMIRSRSRGRTLAFSLAGVTGTIKHFGALPALPVVRTVARGSRLPCCRIGYPTFSGFQALASRSTRHVPVP